LRGLIEVNIFVLNTGRCGSTTFINACRHIRNFSAAHESRTGLVGIERLNYPPNHIEADNRLSWFLGRLDQRFGNEAIYVHLKRDPKETARSYSLRFERGRGIMAAYRKAILLRCREQDPLSLSRDYCDTVTANIQMFLKDKSHVLDFTLENADRDFAKFWAMIRAQGDLDKAISEFGKKYNATTENPRTRPLRKVTRQLDNLLRALR
jgi:hypothetical protein